MNAPQRDPGETGGLAQVDGTSGGALGARPPVTETFHGSDPETAAAPAICKVTPTKCQARTRLYRNGELELEGFPVADISDHLADKPSPSGSTFGAPSHEDLAVLSEEFGLHPLAVEDAVLEHQRPKLDRYRSHLFLTAYAAKLDTATGELATSELSAFITDQALITVRNDDGLDIGAVVDRWDASRRPGQVRRRLSAARAARLHRGRPLRERCRAMDDTVESLEDDLFAPDPQGMQVQRRSFELRKSLVKLRRIVIPMREVVNSLMRRDLHVVTEDMMPYYQDVYDHVLRAADWTDSLRDLVTTILETNLTIQGNRMNVITKKVTSWAAIIAVPTFITGFYGMNVPYPGFSERVGFILSVSFMLVAGFVLYWVFKRKDWL